MMKIQILSEQISDSEICTAVDLAHQQILCHTYIFEIKLHSLKIHSVSHHIPQSHFIGMQYLHDVYVGFVFNYV